MFTKVGAPQQDKIFALIRAFAADPRPEKVDLGVGVYRTDQGTTPIMRAVREAETRLYATETTKSYVDFAGDPAFCEALRELTLGGAVPPDRVAASATTGGTAAVRHALELIKHISPAAMIWVSDPSWPNHTAILDAVGLHHRRYRYLERSAGALDRTGMAEDLAGMRPGDVLLLHGCCHNPSGVDLGIAEWTEIAALCTDTGVLPLVDLAYHGFGDGIEADAAGLRVLAGAVPELFLCVSGSKNFGLYRERAGAVFAVVPKAAQRAALAAQLASLNRLSCSFPPDHGARLVTMILEDPDLRASWEGELAAMRARIQGVRQGLAAALRRETGSDRFGFLAAHNGMFSLLPATPEQMQRLRAEYGVYGVDDGRVNLAGLPTSGIPLAARAIATILG
ncbi:MAG: amino acid aminotransferase [Pseudomonadota bacterium]